MPNISPQILKHMAGAVKSARQSLDPRSKKFLATNGGWAVTLNDIILPLALLHVHDASPIKGDTEPLELAMAGGDGLRMAQEADGQWEFVKIDGSKWGKIYQPWTIYHWCEAYALLRDLLPKKRRDAWEVGLTLCYDGLTEYLATPRDHNIPTWDGMSLVRGGQLFQREDWITAGRRQIDHAIDHQHPHGFWPEGDGPTNGYNGVYVHAIGLYHAFTGDKRALPALKRAATFRTTFAYPDGSAVETIDGRQRYHPGVGPMGWPGYALFPHGRRLIDMGWRQMRKAEPSLSPHLSSYLMYAPQASTEPLPQEGKRHRVVFHMKALTCRSGPWFYTVSGYAPRPAHRRGISTVRWYMSRTNTLSIWHDKVGRIIGGGHSKNDPQFCTFQVWKGAAWIAEPTDIRITNVGGEDRVKLIYDDVTCELRIQPRGPGKLALTFMASAASLKKAGISAGVTLPLVAGEKIRWRATGRNAVDRENLLDPMRTIGMSWSPEAGHRTRAIISKGWSIHMPDASRFEYPLYPFNPYAIDNASEPSQALGLITLDLTTHRQQQLLLHVD